MRLWVSVLRQLLAVHMRHLQTPSHLLAASSLSTPRLRLMVNLLPMAADTSLLSNRHLYHPLLVLVQLLLQQPLHHLLLLSL